MTVEELKEELEKDFSNYLNGNKDLSIIIENSINYFILKCYDKKDKKEFLDYMSFMFDNIQE